MLIPAGNNLGQSIARPAAGANVNPRALNGGIDQAVDNVGRAVSSFGEQEAANDFRQNQVSLRAGEQRMQEEVDARNAADKARAVAVATSTSDALDDLQSQFDDGIQTGAIDKKTATAKFKEQAGKLVSDSLVDAPDIHRPIIQNQLTKRALGLENKVGRAVMKRDRSDTVADLNTAIESAERVAVDDRELGMQQGTAAIDALSTAGVPPAEIAKRKQTFTENVSYNVFLRATNMARTDNGQLKHVADALLADKGIDPTRQTQMLGTISGYQAANDTRAEAAAARAQRQEEARLHRAEAAVNAYNLLSLKGPVADEVTANTAKTVAGTPYAAAFTSMVTDSRVTGSMAVQPVAVQQQRLNDLNNDIAKNGLTPAKDRLRTQMQTVLSQAKSDYGNDPMQAAQDRGAFGPEGLQPLDMSSFQSIAASVGKRVTQAQVAAQNVGRTVSPFTATEADQLGALLQRLPPDQRSASIGTLAGALGPQVGAAVAAQISKKDDALGAAFATSGDKTSIGRNTSELILKGQQAIKDGTSTKGLKAAADITASAWRADIASQVDGMFLSQTARDQVLGAAVYIAHGLASEQGGKGSAHDRTRALEMAMGATITEVNGKKLPIPAGWDEGDFDKSMRNSGGPQILQQAGGAPLRAGGVDVPAQTLVDKLPGAQFQFIGRTGGDWKTRYLIMVGGRPVINAKGQPVVVEAR